MAIGRQTYTRILRVASYVILSVGSLMMLVPFYWMVMTSFKLPSDMVTLPPSWIPSTVTLMNYTKMFKAVPVGTLYRNSLFIAIVKTVVMVFTSALMGYIFAKFEFRGKNLIFGAILASMIIPLQVYLIPLYLLMVNFHWHDSYTGIIVPYVFSAYAIFLYRQFMRNVPTELIEAARMDGCGEFGIFIRIVLPLTTAVLSTLTIFYFMWNWNDFLWPLVVLNSPEKYTLPVGLSVFNSEFSTDYGTTMAGASICIVPVMVVFFLFQRQIVEGVALTGLKG